MADSERQSRWGWLWILALGGGLLFLARGVLVPFLISFVLAYAFHPVARRLEKNKVPRPLAIWLIFLIIVLGIALFLFFVIPAIQAELASVWEKFPGYADYLRKTVLPYLERKLGLRIPRTVEEIAAAILPRLREQAPTLFQPLTFFIGALFSNTARLLIGIANLIMIPFAFYYFLKDFDRLKNIVAGYIPIRYRAEAHKRLKELDRSLNGFIRGQLLVILALAALYGAGLALIGVDLAFALAIIAALGEIVPYVGFIVGLSLSLLVALLQFQDFLHPFYVVLLFTAVQSMQGLVIAPLIMGSQVGLHPLVVLAAVYIGGDLFGLIGVILAVPGAAVLVVLLKALADYYRNSPLFQGPAG